MSKLIVCVVLALVLASGVRAQDAGLSYADYSTQLVAPEAYADYGRPVTASGRAESLLRGSLPIVAGVAAGGLIGYRFGGLMGAAIGGLGGYLISRTVRDLYRVANPAAASSTLTEGSVLASDTAAEYVPDIAFMPAGDAASTTAVSAAEAQAAVDAAYVAYLDALKAGGTGNTQRDAYLTAKAQLDAARAR